MWSGPPQLFSGTANNLSDSGFGASVDRDGFSAPRGGHRSAGKGWRKAVSVCTFGLIKLGPSAKQEAAEELLRRITASLVDVYVVAFINSKGGVGKTTLTVSSGNAIARERGDRVIAVDVDTDLGNLDERFREHGGAHANIEALSALQDAGSFSTVKAFTVQNRDRLEMLAAQNDPRSSYTLNAHDFESAMAILRRHYNVILLDCGTAITSPLFSTIANHVDSLVVVASQDIPGCNGAAGTLDWLQAHNFGRLLSRTTVALNATAKGKPTVNVDDAETKFRERVADVIRIPYDQQLAKGVEIEFPMLRKKTRKALMSLAGAIAQHYPVRRPQGHPPAHPGSF